MRHHPPIVQTRRAQGLNAYRSGKSYTDLVEMLIAIDAEHQQPDLSNEQHEAIEAAGPSIVAGFLDGALEDLRAAAAARRGQRA